jgi:putative flippase GtrA
LILRGVLGAKFTDAQCGFKAVRADVARQLLPHVVDTGWFFDTDLLVIAERTGLRIHEVPVDWVDDPDSRVDIVHTAVNDLMGCWRVGRALASGALPVGELQRSLGRDPLVPGVPRGMVGQMVRFGIVGIASTVAFALLYLLLHPAMGAQAANLTALLLTAIGNTAANRAFTFGIRGRTGAARHQLNGLLVFAFCLAITSGSLFVLHRFDPTVGKVVELSVLVVANLVATLIRFIALRRVFSQL